MGQQRLWTGFTSSGAGWSDRHRGGGAPQSGSADKWNGRAWGDNSDGESTVPAGLSNVVAIAAGAHSVALKADGTLVLWGSSRPEVMLIPADATGVVAIATGGRIGTGDDYTLALRGDGTVRAWGSASSGHQTNLPANLAGVIAVSAGATHALALKSDGSIVLWGNGGDALTPPPGLDGVLEARPGQYTSLAVRSDGTVVEWGSQGVLDTLDMNRPAGVSGVVDAQFGLSHVLALRRDGTVIVWGGINDGQQGSPARGLAGNGFAAIAAGDNFDLYLTARPILLGITPPVHANLGEAITLAVSASGAESYQWSRNGVELGGKTNNSLTITNAQPADAGAYSAFVGNRYGGASLETSISFLPPTISAQPQSLTRYRGETALFSITASGSGPFSYQWMENGTNIAGGTDSILTLTNIRSGGNYSVKVTDAAGGSVQSATATLTFIDPTTKSPVLSPAVDTSIFSTGSNPQGASTILVGTRNDGILDRGLLRFDLSSLPPNALLKSVRLHVSVVKAPRIAAISNFSLYRMLKAWGNDASWANATAGSAWSAAGALAGADYATNASATQLVSGIGAYTFGPTNALRADAQAWIVNPGDNHGWILLSGSEGALATARHFGSSQSAQPPQLLIDYSVPPATPLLYNLSASNGVFRFQINGEAGWVYRIEHRETLGDENWTTITNAPAGAALSPVFISVPILGSQGFYRAAVE